MAEELTLEQKRALALARARLALQQGQSSGGAMPVGAPPGYVAPPAVEPKQGGVIQDIVGGSLRGVYEIPATLTALGEPTLEDVKKTKESLDKEIQQLTNADPTSPVYKGAALVTEVLSTMGLGPLVSGALKLATTGTKAAPVVAPVAEALRVGGMGRTGAGGLEGTAGLGTRAAASATVGSLGGVATQGTPESAVIGGTIGAAVPVVGAAGGAIADLWRGTVSPIMNPSRVAEDVLLRAVGGRGTNAIESLRASRGAAVTPGFKRTLGERLDIGGMPPSPTLEALTERLRTASPETSRQIFEAENRRIGALQAQLARVNERIQQQGRMMTPAALDELTTARDALLRNIEQQQETIEIAARNRAATLPSGPQGSGEYIALRAKELNDEFKKTQVTPAYRSAEKAAGDAPINIDNVIGEVEQVLGRPLSSFAPETAPAIVRRIRALQSKGVTDEPIGRGKISGTVMQKTRAPQATTATLKELDDLRKAINSDVMAASRGTSSLAGIERSNLLGLQRAVDSAIDNSDTLPADAKDLYRKALSIYRDKYAPRFREGETARVLKPGMFGEMRIDPSEVVSRFTANTDAANQFVTTFAGDPQAYAALRQGILGQFRLAAVDPVTLRVDPNKAAGFLQKNAEVFSVLENAGMRIRAGLQQFEQEATQTSQVLEGLKNIGGPFRDKSPEEMLRYITSDGARMSTALKNTSPDGREAIARVLTDRVERLIRENPGKALDTLVVEGRISPAYQQALGKDAVNGMKERALISIDVRKLLDDPVLRRENTVAPWFDKQKFTPDQLTALQPVIDDVKRLRRLSEAGTAGREVATPQVSRLVQETGAETAILQPQQIQWLSTIASVIRNTFTSIDQRINRKVNAELAVLLYNNPDAAEAYLKRAMQRAVKAGRAAGPVVGGAPAAAGAVAAGTVEADYQEMIRSPEETEQ